MKKITALALFAIAASLLLVNLDGDISKLLKTQTLIENSDQDQVPEEEEDLSKYSITQRYRYEVSDQGKNPIYIDPDEEKNFTLTLKNTGKASWDLTEDAENYLVLGTYYPNNRESRLYNENADEWLDPTRISIEDENDKEKIKPKQTLTFEFETKAPTSPGVYREEFLPLLSGLKWLNTEKISWDIVVGGDFTQSYDYEIDDQSSATTLPINGTKEVEITLENTGETPWYNDGPFPIKLVTEDEKSTQALNIDYAVVAEMKESFVQPGETATFELNLTSPGTTGSHQLILKLAIPGLFTLDAKPITYTITVSDKLVALTFDDGYGDIDAFLDVLNEENTKATFFMLGVVAQNNPEAMKRIVNEGHLLACHSYDHPDFRGLSASSIRWQMQACRDAIIEATDGYDPYPYFRYPYGARNAATNSVLEQDGWQNFHWTNGTGDFKYHASSSAGRSHILYYSTLNPPARANVLMHIISRSSLAVLPDIIARYKDMGYALVTVDEL